VTLVEWGALPAETLTPLYQAEESRWRTSLAWDTAATWSTIESARVTWGLPGLVCCDTCGRVRGWTYFLRHSNRVELGGIVSDAREATAALVDGARREGTSLDGFIYAGAVGLPDILAERRVECERYAYLVRPTNRVPFARATYALRAWKVTEIDAAAALLREAYGEDGQLFARAGSLGEWRTYLENLLAYGGCGILRPDLSRLAEVDGRMTALALVSALASDTAHLAQLAVDSPMRRSGLGRTLLAETLKAAHAAGFAQMSLLVAAGNAAARRLYEGWGFAERGEFLALRSVS
jgi:ribosomal protein S18 acetylase RimI-like enzyme